jgi:hypothetical protein
VSEVALCKTFRTNTFVTLSFVSSTRVGLMLASCQLLYDGTGIVCGGDRLFIFWMDWGGRGAATKECVLHTFSIYVGIGRLFTYTIIRWCVHVSVGLMCCKWVFCTGWSQWQ